MQKIPHYKFIQLLAVVLIVILYESTEDRTIERVYGNDYK